MIQSLTKSEPALNTPIEPLRLVEMWREAADKLMRQGNEFPAGSRERGESLAAGGAFVGCAQMLQAWIEFEGVNVMMCMPRSFLALIHRAHEFERSEAETWNALADAAEKMRGASQ